jgi:hypothetical protein
MSKNRMEALSDGVVAIIITIMVLDMKGPHGVCQKAGELGRLLQLHLFISHPGIPLPECLPEFIVEDARARL